MDESNTEVRKFIPERQGVGVDQAIDVLKRPPEYVLEEAELDRVRDMDELLTRGNGLQIVNGKLVEGESEVRGIERIYKTDIRVKKWYPEYFLTEEGSINLREVFELDHTPEFSTIDEVYTFFASVSYEEYRKGFNKRLRDLRKKAGVWTEKRVVASMKENDYEDVDSSLNPHTFTIVENTDEFLTYVKSLRDLKNFHRTVAQQLDMGEMSDGEREATKVDLKMHRARLNQLIAGQYPRAIALVQQHQHLLRINGTSHLGEMVQQLEEHLVGFNLESKMFDESLSEQLREQSRQERLSFIDHFISGASQMDDEHLSSVISAEIRELADELESRQSEEAKEPSTGWLTEIADLKTLSNIQVEPETIKGWIEKVLDEYDMLSSEKFLGTDEEYERPGRVSDGNIQVILDPGRTTFSYNNRQGLLRVPAKKDKPLYSHSSAGGAVVVDHEIGHVIQNESAREYDLPLFEMVGSDRVGAHHEGGAIYWERAGQRALFGTERPSNTHYLRAIEKRLEGGTYVDCAMAFYKSLKRQNPDLDDEKASKQAANRARRLFGRGGSMHDTSGILTSSSTLIYLEQELLMRALTDIGSPEVLLRGKANIFTLADLHRVGLVLGVLETELPQRPTEVIKEDILAYVRSAIQQGGIQQSG